MIFHTLLLGIKYENTMVNVGHRMIQRPADKKRRFKFNFDINFYKFLLQKLDHLIS